MSTARRSYFFYHDILANVKDGVVILENNKITYVNNAFRQLFDIAGEDGIGAGPFGIVPNFSAEDRLDAPEAATNDVNVANQPNAIQATANGTDATNKTNSHLITDFIHPSQHTAFLALLQTSTANSAKDGAVASVNPMTSSASSLMPTGVEFICVRPRDNATIPVEVSIHSPSSSNIKYALFRDLSHLKQVESLRAIQSASMYLPEQLNHSIQALEPILEYMDHNSTINARGVSEMMKAPLSYISNVSKDFITYTKLMSNLVVLEDSDFDFYRMIEEVIPPGSITAYIGVDVPRLLIGDTSVLKQVLIYIVSHLVNNSAPAQSDSNQLNPSASSQQAGSSSSSNAQGNTVSQLNEMQLVIEQERSPSMNALNENTGTTSLLKFTFSGSGKEEWLFSNTFSFDLGFKLPIVKRLIEMMRGKIGIERVPVKQTSLTQKDQGPSASLWFTAAFSNSRAPTDTNRNFASLGVDVGAILLIEKNPTISKIIQSYLDTLKLSSSVADFTEAWNLILNPRAKNYQLILVSEELIGTDEARSFMNALKESEYWHLPLVLLTRSVIDEKNIRSSGFLSYISHPITLENIRHSLEQLYGLSNQPTSNTLAGAPASADARRNSMDLTNAQPSGPSGEKSAKHQHHRRAADVLLVDDNVVNQKILAKILSQMGLGYDVASDGSQAVDRFQKNPNKYGVILMDTLMPVMDGFEATKEIRKHERSLASGNNNSGQTGKRVPIIAVTGIGLGDNAVENPEEKCLRCGMDEYIPKPVIMHNLKNTITKWLKKGVSTYSAEKSLKELSIAVVVDNLQRCSSLSTVSDALVQNIVDALADKRISLHTMLLLKTAKLKRIRIHQPFPAFQINLFISHLSNQDALERLDVSGCIYLTDTALTFISKLPKLQALNLARCARITDWGVCRLRSLKELKEIDLTGCSLVTNSSINTLKQMESLTSIVSALGD